jgi:uncharacterized protein (TIGR02996 family)
VNHEPALLREIIEHPEDSATRLVYADWLEERDDPRAELIRVQSRLAGQPKEGPQHAGLRQRETELLSQHGAAWVGPLRRHLASWEFRRGFVEAVWIREPTFLDHAAALFAAFPLREIVFSGPCRNLERVAESPCLARLERLGFHRSRLGYRLADLARSPHLARLQRLDLTNNGVGREELRQLAHSPRVPQLASLVLRQHPSLGDDSLLILLDSPLAERLHELDLSRCSISDAGARALAASRHLAQLQVLELAGNRISLAGFEAILGSPFWRDGTELRVARRIAQRVGALVARHAESH